MNNSDKFVSIMSFSEHIHAKLSSYNIKAPAKVTLLAFGKEGVSVQKT